MATAVRKSEVSEVSDSDIRVVDIHLDRIFSDEQFNCRGFIPPERRGRPGPRHRARTACRTRSSCSRGAASTARTGGSSPATAGTPPSCSTGAWARGPSTIPSIVKEGLTETQALILNLGENTNRKQLNILQEAQGPGAAAERRPRTSRRSPVAIKVPRPVGPDPVLRPRLPAGHPGRDRQTARSCRRRSTRSTRSRPTSGTRPCGRSRTRRLRAGRQADQDQGQEEGQGRGHGRPSRATGPDQRDARPRHGARRGRPAHPVPGLGRGQHQRRSTSCRDFQQYVDVELGKNYHIPPDGIDGALNIVAGPGTAPLQLIAQSARTP